MQVDAIAERAATTEGEWGREREVLLTALRYNQGGEAEWLQLAALVSHPAEQRYCLRRALALNERNWQALSHVVELGVGPLRYPVVLEQAQSIQQQQQALPPTVPATMVQLEEPPPLPGAPLLRLLILCLLLTLLVVAAHRLITLIP